jgi:hypothetical protein
MQRNARPTLGRRAAALLVTAIVALPTVSAGQGFELGGGDASQSADQLLADQWYHMASDALAGRSEPREDQYTRARLVLDQALELAPEDANLWKMRAELAKRTDNTRRWLNTLSKYVDLAPDDDRAQLDLIIGRVQSLQTVDARVKQLEAVLNSPLAEQLSKPLRSRLASEAAAATQEMSGREDPRFLRHLKNALDLDATNEQAALMMYHLLRSRHRSAEPPQASPLAVGAATVHLTKAAPLDGTVRGTVAEQLAKQAVYRRAAEQFAIAQQLTGGRLSAKWHKAWIRCLAASGQTNAALQQLKNYARRLNQGEQAPQPAEQPAADAAAEKPEATARPEPGTTSDAPATQPAAEATKPAMAELPIHMRILELAMLYLPEQPQRWHSAFDAIWAQLKGPAQQGEMEARKEAAWLAAVFNRKTDAVQPWLDTVPDDARRTQLAVGWLNFHAGDLEEARQQLQPIADRDPMARFGLALINGADTPGRARRMNQVIRSAPQSLGALMAARWLIAQDRQPSPTPVGRSLDELMTSMPRDLWRLNDVRAWLDVQWQIPATQFDYLQPITATLEIRNRSTLPLALGAGNTLPPRTLIRIAPFRGGQSLGTLPPKVVEIDRQLRLNGGQTHRVNVRLDRSAFGRLVTSSPFQPHSFNVTATVNPRSTRRGIGPGLVGGSDTARALSTRTLPATQSNVTTWLDTLENEDRAQRYIALARLVQVVPVDTQQAEQNSDGDQNQPVDQTLLDQIETKVTEAYQSGDAKLRAWILRMIGMRQQNENRFADIREPARRSDQPLVRIAYLAHHVSDPDAPSLQQATRELTGPIKTFAAALRQGLKAQAKAQEAQQQDDDE